MYRYIDTLSVKDYYDSKEKDMKLQFRRTNMEYIVGIDGGGTKTRLVVIDKEGKTLFTSIGGPSNILSSGYEESKRSINTVLTNGILDNDLEFKNCIGMCIGVAGGGRATVKGQIEEIIRTAGFKGKLIVTHDGEIALTAGTEGKEGLLLIAGTGAICYGKNNIGDIVRVSGWGHLVGDEGSAYSIGIKIIRAVMKAYDGRAEATLLSKLLLTELGFSNEEEIITHIYRPQFTKEHIAALAVLIEEGIKNNDNISLKIANETVDDLTEAASSASSKLGFKDKDFRLIIDGSVLLNNSYIRNGFINNISKELKYVQVTTREKEAAYGAALMILKEIDRVRL